MMVAKSGVAQDRSGVKKLGVVAEPSKSPGKSNPQKTSGKKNKQISKGSDIPAKATGDATAAARVVAKDEIDAIFASAKVKSKADVAKQVTTETNILQVSGSNSRVGTGVSALKAGSQGELKTKIGIIEPLKPRKRTQEGYKVYGEEELRWNRKGAGGTPLCPFDCQCCF